MVGPAATRTTAGLLWQMAWRSAGWALLVGIALGLPAIRLYGLGLLLPPLAVVWGLGNGLALGLLTRACAAPLEDPWRYRRTAGIVGLAAPATLLYLGAVRDAPGGNVTERAAFTTVALLGGVWAAVTGWDRHGAVPARALRSTIIGMLVGLPYAYWLWHGPPARASPGADTALFLAIWGALLVGTWWVGRRVAAWYIGTAQAAQDGPSMQGAPETRRWAGRGRDASARGGRAR